MANNEEYIKPSTGKSGSLQPFIARTAMILLCLVLASSCLMGGLLAKYSTLGSGSDEARVAKFEVFVNGVQKKDIQCTSTQKSDGIYTISVSNASEVSVSYTLSVSMSGDAADGIVAAFDSDEGTLAPNATSTDHTLTFSVSDWSMITDHVTGSTATVSLPFTVIVNIEQID